MRPPRSLSAVPLLLLAVFAAASFDADFLRRAVLRENDPVAAVAFLRDGGRQAALRNEDPALYSSVMARALELQDFSELTGGGARVIRLAVVQRERCAFCRDASAYRAWAQSYAVGGPRAPDEIEKALYLWLALPQFHRDRLRAEGLTQAAWSGLNFAQRHERMRAWALAERAAILASAPADAPGAQALEERVRRVDEILGNEEMATSWAHLQRVNAGVTYLAEAARRVEAANDPRQLELLATARSAPDAGARLEALGRLFDNFGPRPTGLITAAPSAGDPGFDAARRDVAFGLLRSALLDQTDGTFAGADLREFYRTHPLNVRFSPTSRAALGWYEPSDASLNFNQRYVEEFLARRGATLSDLARGGPLMGDLARELSGTFVHEAQHQRQFAWAADNGQANYYVQGNEVESFQVQALFTLQKLRTDPAFAAYAAREAERSSVLAEHLARARLLEGSGPQAFARTVPGTHYPEVLSNEAKAWCAITLHNAVGPLLQAELDRRAALPAAARAALDSGPELGQSYPTEAEFRAALSVARTPSVRLSLQRGRELAEAAPGRWARFQARSDSILAQTMERYRAVLSDQAPERLGVPAPPAEAMGR